MKIIAPLFVFMLLFSAAPVSAAEPHVLHSRVHAAVANLTPVGRLPASNRLNLVIGVTLRDQAGLDKFLQEIYDPASTNFHHYLTHDQFTAKFAATEADYQTVLAFARSNSLQVIRTYDDRRMVDVSATVSDIEKTFHVTMRNYQHPTENRIFYAPDADGDDRCKAADTGRKRLG